ncbi:major facilitator superfamily domain-containing protein [Lentinula aff. detonsa]|uniref:Major facilitator superfamily domain-containing protein n=1 Tax=Lentinula aff. detonsa TaxID=2804958 RepID=A0AA38NQK6_9AGAR|nr:major facilitator superfamily domain-containing protein [Lentinula aff. detonsa]
MTAPTTTGQVSSISDTESAKLEPQPVQGTLPAAQPQSKPGTDSSSPKRGLRFWLIFLAVGFALFLSPLELTSVSTALPSIVRDLGGDNFIWITSSYTLASTAILPMSGGIAQIFGRRPAMLLALALFSLGSALCGSAKSIAWLIGARTVQGMGGGGILSISNIIISDLVPLKERGAISGVLGLVWALAAALGPLIGGAFTKGGQWRWLFYMNLPICGVAFALVLLLLELPTPPGNLKDKLRRMDWIGNGIVIASSTAVVIALTWGGATFPWSSFRVLVPLIVGLAGIVGFGFYEALVAKEPIMPFSLLTNRTSLSGYIQTFINPVVMLSVIYYLPAYFQACKGASPLRSGVETFGLSMTLGPVVILCGWSVTKLAKYRPQAWFGWIILIIGTGLLSTVHAETSLAHSIGYSALISIGGGLVYAITYFPVLAPLQISQNAYALAFFAFCRSFAGVWGVTIGGTILQNELSKRLPPSFAQTALNGGSADIAYSLIPIIQTLEEPLRTQVQDAFAESIIRVWQTMIGIAGIGLLSSVFMKEVAMHKKVDQDWALKEKERKEKEKDVESGSNSA